MARRFSRPRRTLGVCAGGASDLQDHWDSLRPTWVPRIDTPQCVSEQQGSALLTGPSVVDLGFTGLGVDGLFLAVSCSVAASVTFYDSVAAWAPQKAPGDRPGLQCQIRPGENSVLDDALEHAIGVVSADEDLSVGA
jgi:hypothetical protein